MTQGTISLSNLDARTSTRAPPLYLWTKSPMFTGGSRFSRFSTFSDEKSRGPLMFLLESRAGFFLAASKVLKMWVLLGTSLLVQLSGLHFASVKPILGKDHQINQQNVNIHDLSTAH